MRPFPPDALANRRGLGRSGAWALLIAGALAVAPVRSQPLATAADVALLEDFETGAVLFQKNADEPMAPASIAKLLTAEIVFDRLKAGTLSLDDEFAVSERVWRQGGAPARGAAMFLSPRTRVRVEDLLRGLLVQSGNDAAMAIAEGLAGSEEGFAELMNRRAAELGMTHSHFANSRGKADPNQHVTARDLALLAEHVIRAYPEYFHFFSEKEFTWNKIRQLNRNPAIGADFGADGLKAGDIGDGGYAILATAAQDGRRLILVLNGLKSAADRLEETRKMFNAGFHDFDKTTLFEPNAPVGEASVHGGATAAVPLVSAKPVILFTQRGESEKLTAKIVYSGPLVAPVAEGADAGRLKVWRGDMQVVDAPLKTGAGAPLGSLFKRALDGLGELAGDAVRRTIKRVL